MVGVGALGGTLNATDLDSFVVTDVVPPLVVVVVVVADVVAATAVATVPAATAAADRPRGPDLRAMPIERNAARACRAPSARVTRSAAGVAPDVRRRASCCHAR